jgi:hypothetical protein
MAKRRGKDTIPVERATEIPSFSSEEEEARYWSEHELGVDLLESMEPLEEDILPPPRTVARPVSIRFEQHLLDRLRSLSSRRGMRYQTLLKQFVVERIYEEERREGIVTPERDRTTQAGRQRSRGERSSQD